jgi:plastocyanin
MSPLPVIVALLSSSPAARLGELSGTVRVVAAAVASRVSGSEEVIIYLEDAPNSAGGPKGPFEMKQLGKEFKPSVLVVTAGATVAFPNLDSVFHNVFSVTPGNTFDLGLHKTGDTATTRLTAPGVVSVYCDIHPQMIGFIVVVTNPFFTRAGPEGDFFIKGIPPGTYHAVAWFPYGPPVRQEVQIDPGAPARWNVVLRERSDAGRHDRKDGSLYLQYGAGAAR